MQHQENYMRFVLNDFIPTLDRLGLSNVGVWHTAYGNYPIRLLVFVAKDSAAMQRALGSSDFVEIEDKLKTFVTDYTRRVVPFDERFQF
ncbi:MAG: hypothetical protein HY782_27765 [Chloroflexi bacterium]|nr:hypothetical protein [Chloroflexota bacterium]